MDFSVPKHEITRMNPSDQEREIRHAIAKAAGSPLHAARILGISRSYFWYLLRKLNLGGVPAMVRRAIRESK